MYIEENFPSAGYNIRINAGMAAGEMGRGWCRVCAERIYSQEPGYDG